MLIHNKNTCPLLNQQELCSKSNFLELKKNPLVREVETCTHGLLTVFHLIDNARPYVFFPLTFSIEFIFSHQKVGSKDFVIFTSTFLCQLLNHCIRFVTTFYANTTVNVIFVFKIKAYYWLCQNSSRSKIKIVSNCQQLITLKKHKILYTTQT